MKVIDRGHVTVEFEHRELALISAMVRNTSTAYTTELGFSPDVVKGLWKALEPFYQPISK